MMTQCFRFALVFTLVVSVTNLALHARHAPQPKDEKKDDNAPIPKDKWNLEFAEKTWDITLKSMTYKEDATKTERKQYHFLFEFSKTLNEAELTQIRMALTQGQAKWEIVFFDADNVIVDKVIMQLGVEGEISGTKGDAFRLMIAAPKRTDVVKAEMRAKK
jgi:hypothetical protein